MTMASDWSDYTKKIIYCKKVITNYGRSRGGNKPNSPKASKRPLPSKES